MLGYCLGVIFGRSRLVLFCTVGASCRRVLATICATTANLFYSAGVKPYISKELNII